MKTSADGERQRGLRAFFSDQQILQGRLAATVFRSAAKVGQRYQVWARLQVQFGFIGRTSRTRNNPGGNSRNSLAAMV